ncbi:hypothetical protein D9613_009023 [Agrocybe pediades]|uniref:Uncharacterized protein n=1 Tax=Agrocybe pediades TaxID=84607 RepID=A0A8H4R5M3_9AGAR|nr:hypothetical protein D9613_009023 [Agrocybe pediades]
MNRASAEDSGSGVYQRARGEVDSTKYAIVNISRTSMRRTIPEIASPYCAIFGPPEGILLPNMKSDERVSVAIAPGGGASGSMGWIYPTSRR